MSQFEMFHTLTTIGCIKKSFLATTGSVLAVEQFKLRHCQKLGKYDFKFEGNRLYKNHVVEFDGLVLVGPSKWELVTSGLDKGFSFEMLTKLAEFQKEMVRMTTDYVYRHPDKLEDLFRADFQQFVSLHCKANPNRLEIEWNTLCVPKPVSTATFAIDALLSSRPRIY